MFWPLGASDVALLRAALLDGDDAIAAFRDWRSLIDIDGRHDNGQFRMLPMVYANMSRLGHDDPVMGRLRGVYRQNWVRARQRLAAAEETLLLLEAAGIPTMVTKGIALATSYYPSPTLRPMNDIDILVQRSRVEDARQALGASGWHNDELNELARRGLLPHYMARRPGIDLKDRTGRVVDLHWSPIHECGQPAFVEWFWRGGKPISIGTAETLYPTPSRLLLHVVSHGLRPLGVSHLQWATDATMILNTSGADIDWTDFWSMARKARLAMRVSEGLRRLAVVVSVYIPPGARHHATPSIIELLERPSLSRRANGNSAGIPERLRFLANILRIAREVDARTFIGVANLKMRDWRERRHHRSTEPY